MFASRVLPILPMFVNQDMEAASPPPVSEVTSAVTEGLATTATNAMGVIASVLPYALAIVGAVIVVTLGIKVFKRISGR